MNDDVVVSAAMADVCFIIHLVCLFMKMHLLALLQDICLDLVCCAFLHKLSGCVRNITEFCQYLLGLMKSAILANTNILVKPKYRPNISPGRYIGLFLLETSCEKTENSTIVATGKPEQHVRKASHCGSKQQ